VIKGEVWSVDDETLTGLDEYEGISKGYYNRREITVSAIAHPNKHTKVHAYFKIKSTPELAKGPFLEEYSLDIHQTLYKAIKRIFESFFCLTKNRYTSKATNVPWCKTGQFVAYLNER
jgi:hypothetical protein